MNFDEKKYKLYQIIENLLEDRVILAFSGGVDSALILKIASSNKDLRKNIKAVFFKSLSTTDEELENAKSLAKDFGVDFIVKEVDILTDPNIKTNAKDRCYHCKKMLFSKAIDLKDKFEFAYVVDGTNTDDYKVYRPGLVALRDLGVISPLKEAGFDKKDVRSLAGELGISVAKKPSAPCLLTRFAYGDTIDYEKLRRVDQGEKFLKTFAFKNLRLRDHKGLARIEILPEDFKIIIDNKNKIIKTLKDLGFSYITLDLEGFRSGSMDEKLSDDDKKRWQLDGQ